MTWRQYHQSNIWLTLLISLKVPLITVHDQPYLISVLSKSIEIRTDEPSVLIQVFPPLPSVIFFIWPLLQTVEVPRPRLATRAAQGRVYIAAQGLVRYLPWHIGSNNLTQPQRCGCWPWCLWQNKSLSCSGTSSLNWWASAFRNEKLILMSRLWLWQISVIRHWMTRADGSSTSRRWWPLTSSATISSGA